MAAKSMKRGAEDMRFGELEVDAGELTRRYMSSTI